MPEPESNTRQCAWCSPNLDPTASHGVCARCAGEVEARTWQPRMEREIAQILSESEASSQNSAVFSNHLTPEETAAKADALRAAWAGHRRGGGVVGNTHELDRVQPHSLAKSLTPTGGINGAGSNPARPTFSPPPPTPYVPRNRVDPVRVLCYAAVALWAALWVAGIVRWVL